MTSAPQTLVLRDEHGTYYILSAQLLEQARVPAERIAEVAQFLMGTETEDYPVVPQSGGEKPPNVLGWWVTR